ncbi:MAG: hypothetical protein Q9207_007072 [Kuettlingeria erythrocarpa]
MSVSDALKPPPGQVVDYVNSESIGHRVVDASLSTIVLATAAVVLRLIVKLRITKSPGWDDDGASVITPGMSLWLITSPCSIPTTQFIQINLVMYLFAIMFAKLSILIFYHRLFGVNVAFRRAVFAVSAIVVGYCLSLALATIFQCTPPAAVWDLKLRMQTNNCISLIKIEIAIGGFNIPTDIIILLLPAPMLWKLQMPWSRKLGLMAILATGIFVCATAIIRQAIIVSTLHDADQAWTIVDAITWLGIYPVEDSGSTDHEKHTYRVLVESHREKRMGKQGAPLANTMSEKSLPQIPLDIIRHEDVFRAQDRLDHDLESGSTQMRDRSGV